MTLEDRPVREPNAAGSDIGAREIFVAVPADRDENPVRVFPTFTADLEAMARWLVSCGITTVAMESTDPRHPAHLYWRQAPRCSALSERQDAQASAHVVTADQQRRMKCLGPSLLDSALRCAGAARGYSRSGKRPQHEKCAGASDRLAGMPVAAVPAFGRFAASCLPAGWRGERSTEPAASPHRSGTDRRPAYSTHAKIADADEPTNSPREQRNHRRDRCSDGGRYQRGTARPGGAGQTARPRTRGTDAWRPCPGISPGLDVFAGHHASEEIVQKSLVGNWKREHLFTLKQSRQIY